MTVTPLPYRPDRVHNTKDGLHLASLGRLDRLWPTASAAVAKRAWARV